MTSHEKQSAPETVTLSTRFEHGEMEVIKKAAELKGWSLSKLLRVSTYQKSAHILNVNSNAVNQIRSVLTKVVVQLFKPELELEQPDAHDLALDSVYTLMDVEGVGIGTLPGDKFDDFVTAIQSLGAEIAPILEEEYERLRTSQGDFRANLISPDLPKSDSDFEAEGPNAVDAIESTPAPPSSKKTSKRKKKGRSNRK